jgi:hypothetical protein
MTEVVYESESLFGRSVVPRISARAVVSGFLVALITQVMLLLLGAAIGLSALTADVSSDTAQGVGIGASVWLILSLCLSSLFGAYIAAVIAHTGLRREGLLHGLVTWAAASLFGLFVVSSALGGLVSGAMGVTKSVAQTAGQAAQTTGMGPSLSRQATTPEAQARVGESVEEAQQAIQNPENQQKAAKGAAIGAWGLVLAHLLPAGFALLGGFLGARSERKITYRRGPILDRTERPIVTGPTVPQPT